MQSEEGFVNTPALRAWRAELAAGKRAPTTLDTLWRAACEEANALEAHALGLDQAAMASRRAAVRILRSAAPKTAA